MGDDLERVSMDEIEAEDATALPNKEVMSLLDVNANVDLGLDLAAPVDLAVAANLNVAAPIEAAAGANLLSDNAEATAVAQQHGTINQGISGSAEATAPQHADISQDANPDEPAAGGATPTPAPAPAEGGVVDGGVEALPDVPGGALPDVPDGTVPDVTDPVTDGVGSLLQGGSLLDADVNIHANADLTAPINGAVAANANVAAPIDAAVAANVGSDGATAQALADQQVNINQSLDDVSADATAEQDTTIDQR
ncbi:MAG TPA: hypothetical protein VFX51_11180 [Solirubrobacteraceae bacterium]|nr:hypothetical protein [Solirubrobacteraceae bacterium]